MMQPVYSEPLLFEFQLNKFGLHFRFDHGTKRKPLSETFE